MTSPAPTDIWGEIHHFSESLSALDSLPIPSPEKRSALISALHSKISLETAVGCLASAGDGDCIKAAERAVSALMDSSAPEEKKTWLKRGLESGDGVNRVSALNKMKTLVGHVGGEIAKLAAMSMRDVDTKVATKASEFCLAAIKKRDEEEVKAVWTTLLDIAEERMTAGGNTADVGTCRLRVWETACSLCVENPNGAFDVEATQVLDSMFECLQFWNEDDLFVLNLVEIASRLIAARGSNFLKTRQFSVIKALTRHANESPFVADDALRLLAVVHGGADIGNQEGPIRSAELDGFFEAIHRRLGFLDRNEFSLAAVESLGTFIGCNAQAMQITRDVYPEVLKLWKSYVLKLAHGGNDIPRTSALMAFAFALRGGIVQTYNTSDAQTKQAALQALDTFREELPEMLKNSATAIQSLHPSVQSAAYNAMRVVGSQNAPWGVQSLFQYVPNNFLLDEKMPSPNASREQFECRFALLSSCQKQWLNPLEDGDLLVAIEKAMNRGPIPSAPAMQREAQVATMRR